jgi:DNA-binding transcriptional regulator YiaG
MKKPTTKALNCACGGVLKEASLDSYDFSGYTGFHTILQNVPGLRCTKCGGETLHGGMIHMIFKCLIVEIAKTQRRLSSNEARFLRRVMNMTQQELATRMAIARETVAKWECGDAEISPQHDFILRVVVLTPLIRSNPTMMPKALWMELLGELQAARNAPPEKLDPVDLTQYKQSLAKKRKTWPASARGEGLAAEATV